MTPYCFGLTDIGVSRQNNEDVWVSLPEIGFFALADGMGGHQAGEIAAQEAINHLCKLLKKTTPDDFLDYLQSLPYAIEEANLFVHQMGNANAELNGMGTTLCCLLIREKFAIYAHVGDSRIYRLRSQKLELLTQDHSLFAKWLKTCKTSSTPFPYKNVITRAIGTSSKANPEIAYCECKEGDTFLLCSDGLSDVLSLEDIEKILLTSPDFESAGKELIEKAKLKGSCDNITLLLIAPKLNHEKDLSRQQCNDLSRPESSPSDADGLKRPSL
jgi:serine/threonine protein phosphatase PrpC